MFAPVRHRWSVLSALPVLVSCSLVVAACDGGSSADGTDTNQPASVPDATVSTTASTASTTAIASTTTADPAGDGEGDIEQTCAELQVVQDLSDQIAASTNNILLGALENPNAASDPATVESFKALAVELDELLPDTLAAYDRAIAVAPPDIADEIRTVADGTAVLTPPLIEAFANIESVADLAEIDDIFSEPEMQEAGRSAGISSLRLDNFTNPNCGFRFSNS